MVVVAIVAILASIGIPAYREYVRRSQLQEAFAVLSDYGVSAQDLGRRAGEFFPLPIPKEWFASLGEPVMLERMKAEALGR